MSTRSPRSVVTFPIVLRELTALRVSDVTPGMRRVTLGGPQLHAFEHTGLSLPPLLLRRGGPGAGPCPGRT
ncbi:hypothetical protein ACH4XT_39330 [Streptomyces avidinii]|uniref:hypothetical protein n=1 Tax=Streptomyces avidinii TaxID=1895 RepID=UPI0037B1AB23